MKKYWFYVITLLCLFIPSSVFADNIYRIDIDMNLLEDGSAIVTEIWDVRADSGSEWYKQVFNVDNVILSDFKVLMDGNELTYKSWNINESLSQKSGYYGINYVEDGMELCFGKGDFNRHKFTLSYKLSNLIINLTDAQALQWMVLPDAGSGLDNFSVTVHGFYEFPDTLDVWGYGYQGYAYVKDGKITMTNDGYDNNDYVALLVKFPLSTFNTDNKLSKYESFDDLFEAAEDGKFEYDYGYKKSFWEKLRDVLYTVFSIAIPILLIFGIRKSVLNNKYGYKDNKVIDKKNTPMFRDIPCNKDIYYGNALIYLNNFGYKDTNILGAIMLKWVREDKIKFINTKSGIFNKESSALDLTLNPSFEYDLEQKLFDMMYEASLDGILETKELEKWCRNNYSKFLTLFESFRDNQVNKLRSNQYIYKRSSKEECKYGNVMNDKIYNDSQQLYGLKLFLEEFSKMNEKEVMDVKLWDEYLMFAYLFGIADKVGKQLKNLYPEVLEEANFNYDTIVFVNSLSTRSVHAASSARAAAESYSSGGGGFSSGGGGHGFSGGGGSFGGR